MVDTEHCRRCWQLQKTLAPTVLRPLAAKEDTGQDVGSWTERWTVSALDRTPDVAEDAAEEVGIYREPWTLRERCKGCWYLQRTRDVAEDAAENAAR